MDFQGPEEAAPVRVQKRPRPGARKAQAIGRPVSTGTVPGVKSGPEPGEGSRAITVRPAAWNANAPLLERGQVGGQDGVKKLVKPINYGIKW